MMERQEKYVAYVGTYTHGSSIGIHVYDIDLEEGHMTEREVVPVNNASHMVKSCDSKYLYSIADEGVEVLKILEDGGLEPQHGRPAGQKKKISGNRLETGGFSFGGGCIGHKDALLGPRTHPKSFEILRP